MNSEFLVISFGTCSVGREAAGIWCCGCSPSRLPSAVGASFSVMRVMRPRSNKSSACNSMPVGKRTCSVVKSARWEDGSDLNRFEVEPLFVTEHGSLIVV